MPQRLLPDCDLNRSPLRSPDTAFAVAQAYEILERRAGLGFTLRKCPPRHTVFPAQPGGPGKSCQFPAPKGTMSRCHEESGKCSEHHHLHILIALLSLPAARAFCSLTQAHRAVPFGINTCLPSPYDQVGAGAFASTAQLVSVSLESPVPCNPGNRSSFVLGSPVGGLFGRLPCVLQMVMFLTSWPSVPRAACGTRHGGCCTRDDSVAHGQMVGPWGFGGLLPAAVGGEGLRPAGLNP